MHHDRMCQALEAFQLRIRSLEVKLTQRLAARRDVLWRPARCRMLHSTHVKDAANSLTGRRRFCVTKSHISALSTAAMAAARYSAAMIIYRHIVGSVLLRYSRLPLMYDLSFFPSDLFSCHDSDLLSSGGSGFHYGKCS